MTALDESTVNHRRCWFKHAQPRLTAPGAESTLPRMREADVIGSRIEQVTVFASGARVRRTTTLRGPQLPGCVRIGDLPLAVIDDTVRAEVDGGAVVTALRAGFTTPIGPAAAEEDDALRAARTRLEIARSEVQRLELSLDRLVSSKAVVDDPSDEPPAAWSAVIAARRALVTARSERQLALRQQLAAARHEATEAERALQVARERDHRSGTARAAKAHEQRKHVELDLAVQPGAGDVTIHLEYQVAAARWAPSYVARLDADATRFELRAVVAQNTGEDWTGVALRLSTAEPDQFAPLPELHPQKIGRRQAEPAKRGFRAPPAGAEALYADYLAKFPPTRHVLAGATSTSAYDADEGGAGPSTMPTDGAPPAGVVWDEESSRAKDAYQGLPNNAPLEPMPVMPAAMPRGKSGGIASAIVGGIAGAAAAPFALAAQAVAKKPAPPGGGGGMGMDRLEEAKTQALAAPPSPRLDYGALRMGAPDAGTRGKLTPVGTSHEASAANARVADALTVLGRLPLPPGHIAAWGHTYDYAFAADGNVDVKSDGTWHSLALTARPGKATLHHVAVPREQDDVFRVATITNPFEGPLLPGPIDVYDRGQFLLTSVVDFTPPGGSVDVGLGVDAAVKVARNSEFHEEAAGMLRGALRLHHSISIEVENLSPRAIDLEVRERIPVAREGDDDVEVVAGRVEPAWERWIPDPDAPHHARPRGTYRWRVEISPRAKKLLRAAYEIKIAGKNELVGGNRREP